MPRRFRPYDANFSRESLPETRDDESTEPEADEQIDSRNDKQTDLEEYVPQNILDEIDNTSSLEGLHLDERSTGVNLQPARRRTISPISSRKAQVYWDEVDSSMASEDTHLQPRRSRTFVNPYLAANNPWLESLSRIGSQDKTISPVSLADNDTGPTLQELGESQMNARSGGPEPVTIGPPTLRFFVYCVKDKATKGTTTKFEFYDLEKVDPEKVDRALKDLEKGAYALGFLSHFLNYHTGREDQQNEIANARQIFTNLQRDLYWIRKANAEFSRGLVANFEFY